MAPGLDSTNEVFQLAVDLVNQSNRNIFLTGKAGTGKTTFLRYIREHSLKQTAVVAPTGVAAINAGGSTIHSFFQLPFSPYLPESIGTMNQAGANNKHTLFGKIKLNRERIKIFQQLELLIIDEISMVRCDILDVIDVVLRHYRNRHAEAFGGVQVLLIGDMFQLPPVTVDEEWSLLSSFYSSPYFFDSRIMQQVPPVYVEFEKIYRQSDNRFIDLLNQVRNNALSAEGKEILSSLYNPDFKVEKEDDYIILTTHNYKADAINNEEITRLNSKFYSFKASIEGEFSEKAFPADEILKLKEGAQVMFIKNDKEKIKRYYNGKIGTITRITDDGIFVQCKNESDEIEVQKEKWENIRYAVNKSNNQLEEDVIGSFTQYPLRLAWAITIHKSQGLTFERAVIDAGAAFAAGQVYVALSRCTSLEGIILKSQITSSSLRSDDTIVHFSKQFASADQLKDELQQSKKSYQQHVLLNLFDLKPVIKFADEINKLVQQNEKDFNDATLPWINEVEQKLTDLQVVADKFRLHLNYFFSEEATPEENQHLQKRIKDAAGFFVKELDQVLQFVSKSPAVTDSKMQAKSYNEALKDVFISVAEKKHLMNGFADGFSIEKYYHQKKSFVIPSASINAYATASEEKKETNHPELHYQLRQLRNKICEQKNLPVYIVASTKSIDEMVQFLPQTKDELVKISGFGKAKADKYGEQFLSVLVEYCTSNGLSSLISEKNPKKERKTKDELKPKVDTKAVSYELYKEGNTIAEIAKIRNLSISTIEGHMAFYVGKGMVSVNDLVKTEKIVLIEPLLSDFQGGPITSLIQKMDNKVSYGELRLVLAAKEWDKTKHAST